MLKLCLFLTLLLLRFGLNGIFSKIWFVNQNGRDTSHCGNSSLPCQTIQFTVDSSKSGDTIFIHAAREPYKECERCGLWKSAITINKSLSIRGLDGNVVIQCRKSCSLFQLRGHGLNTLHIFLANLSIEASNFAVHFVDTFAELVLQNSVFSQNSVGIHTKNTTHCSIQIVNSTFEENGWGILTGHCLNLTVDIRSSVFYSSPVLLKTIQDQGAQWQVFNVLIYSCAFLGSGMQTEMCAPLLEMTTVAMVTNITAHKLKIARSYGACDDGKALAIHEAANNHREFTSITLNDLLVLDNYNQRTAIYLIPFYKRPSAFKVKIINSIFRNNTGALLVSVKWKKYTIPMNVYILLENNTFLNNHHFRGRDLSWFSPVIYFGRGRHRMSNCHFYDNYPKNTPNSAIIAVGDDARMVISDCHFVKTVINTVSVQLYAQPNSKILFKGNSSFDIAAAKGEQVILTHLPPPGRGTVGEIQVRGTLTMLCPPGYRMKLLGQKRRSTALTWSYFYSACNQCPRKTYSIERGKLENNITNKIHCFSCPRGGVCEAGQLRSKPNFWGYVGNGNEVKMLSCPPGYCCHNKNCKSYNGCRGNRTGTLCGRCRDGTLELLFDTKCRENEKCEAPMFWVGIFTLLSLYILFFLYYVEIVRFLLWSLPFKKRPDTATHDHRADHSSGVDPRRSGFLKIIFFYYQIVHILSSSVNSKPKIKILADVEEIFSQTLNMVITKFSLSNCPLRSLCPVTKAILHHSVGPCLLVLIAVMYLLSKLFNWAKAYFRKARRIVYFDPDIAAGSQQNLRTSSFDVRLGCAFTHISLLMYSSLVHLCSTLLHCVPVGEHYVLFIDGTTHCYQLFQYFVVLYVGFSILPFCLVPVLGSYSLSLHLISVRQFYVGCIFPLPFCCYWFYCLFGNCKERRAYHQDAIELESEIGQLEDSSGDDGRKAIVNALSGPFRDHKAFCGLPGSQIPWEGVLIFRRLIIISVFTLTYDNRLRSILSLSICVVILVSHLHVRPFIRANENFFETISLSFLIIVTGFTLTEALYYGEDCSSLEKSSTLLNAFKTVEHVLVITPALAGVFLVTLAFLYKLLRFLAILTSRMVSGLLRMTRHV